MAVRNHQIGGFIGAVVFHRQIVFFGGFFDFCAADLIFCSRIVEREGSAVFFQTSRCKKVLHTVKGGETTDKEQQDDDAHTAGGLFCRKTHQTERNQILVIFFLILFQPAL